MSTMEGMGGPSVRPAPTIPLKTKGIPRSYSVTWTPYLYFKAVVRTIYILVNNFYGIPTYMLWTTLLLRPLLWFQETRQLYWKLEGFMFRYLLIQVGDWLWTAGYKIRDVGDDMEPYLNERCLVLCNHQSTGDVPLLMYSLQNKGECGHRPMWIMDKMFKYSNFGIVSQVHGDFFIQQGKSTRSQQTVLLREHLKSVYEPNDMGWIFLFPEGGFLRKRREASQRFGRKNNLPILEHVTLPRVGAMKCIIDTLCHRNGTANGVTPSNSKPKQQPLKYVVDMTIGYPQGQPLDMFCVMFGHRPPCLTQIHYRVYPIEQVPTDQDAMLQWLYQRYVEKETLLDEFYANGVFPQHLAGQTSGHVLKEGRDITLSRPVMVLLHLFGMVSLYYMFKVLMFIWSILSTVISFFLW